MARPTQIIINLEALSHNLAQVKSLANQPIIAMVKANAYGCGIDAVVPILDDHVLAFGVASLEEALAIRKLGSTKLCILFQGVFSIEEWEIAATSHFACVIHQAHQLQWLLASPLSEPITIWLKVNTGMYRLGFKPDELLAVMQQLQSCPWVNKDIHLLTHFACADEPHRIENNEQMALFNSIKLQGITQRSMANSAAIIAFPQSHAERVRAGIMLYGVSPFADQSGMDLGLKPVMQFVSALTAIYHNPPSAPVGYGGTWVHSEASIIGIVPVGYGDGYPRHVAPNTPVWINGHEIPIVGRISMDMMAIDLTHHPMVKLGDSVELWGEHLPVERIAKAAGTIAYELLCQVTERPRRKKLEL